MASIQATLGNGTGSLPALAFLVPCIPRRSLKIAQFRPLSMHPRRTSMPFTAKDTTYKWATPEGSAFPAKPILGLIRCFPESNGTVDAATRRRGCPHS